MARTLPVWRGWNSPREPPLAPIELPFSQALDKARTAVERELVNAILAELAGKLTNRQINRIGTSAKHNEPVRVVGPSDLFFASHRSTIEVTPNLVVWKGTPMPSIGGQVHLKWWDDYDWNPNRPYFPGVPIPKPIIPMDSPLFAITYRDLDALQACTNGCSAPGSLDTSLSHAAGLIEIAACHA